MLFIDRSKSSKWSLREEWKDLSAVVNHMKDIHEVKETQPLSFNHVRCRGMAARAGSVYLLNGPEAGSEGQGQNTPITAPSSSSKRPIHYLQAF